MAKSKCDTCILKISKFCVSSGEPENIIGIMPTCIDYFPESNSITYDEGFRNGYIECLSRLRGDNNG